MSSGGTQKGIEYPWKWGKQPLDMLKGLLKDESGASAVEYAILLAFITTLICVAVKPLGQPLADMFTTFSNTITTTMGS